MKAKTLKQTSIVTGKEQYYLRLTTNAGEYEYVMTIGEKSYNQLTKMLEKENEQMEAKPEEKTTLYEALKKKEENENLSKSETMKDGKTYIDPKKFKK